MVAWIKFGPRHSSAGKNIPVLPKLQAWSDAAFLSWKSRGGGANLRYVFSMSIMNQQFPFIIGRALHEVKKRKDASDFSEYDECSKFLWGNRAEFNLDTDAGKALLGSPNGRGVGYLLAQHKSTFGAKGTVNKVTFFCSGGQGEGGNFEEMHLLFHVIPDLGGSENKRPNEEEHEKPPPPTEGVP